jgi:putative methionine-R-sulfoxide reductase with GAF domain
VTALIIAGLTSWRFLGTRGFTDLSLRNKFISAFLIVTLVPLAGLAYYNILVTRQILTDDADAVLSGSAAQTAASLDDFFTDGINNVRASSQSYVWQEFLALPASERAGSDLEYKLNIELRALARGDQIFIESVGLMDKNGIDVADTSSGEVGSNKSTHRYVFEPLRTGEPYSSVQISPTTDKLSVYFSAPVRNTDGKIIGVLRIRYKADVLQYIVAKAAGQSNVKDIEIILLDENQIRLAVNNDTSFILKSIMPLPADKLAQLQAEFRLPQGLSAEELSTVLPEFAEGLDNAASQPIFDGETKPEAVDDDGSIERISTFEMETQPWLVVAAQPKNLYTVPVEAQIRTIGVIVLFVAMVVVLAAVVIARLLSTPIIQFRNAANQIANGDLQAQVSVDSRDEIGQLAVTFNSMTAQLRELVGTLETRVADRTRALAASAEVSRRLSTILDERDLVKEVVEQVKNAFDYYHAHIYLYDDKNENLVMAGGTGQAGQTMLARGHRIPRGKGLVGRAGENNIPVLVPDTSQDLDWLPNPLLPETKSEAAVPISIGDRVLGVLDVQDNVTNRLKQDDVDLLQSIANQVAIAVQNARSYETAQKEAEEEAIIASISRKIQNTTNIENALQVTVKELAQALGASETRILLDALDVESKQRI